LLTQVDAEGISEKHALMRILPIKWLAMVTFGLGGTVIELDW